MTVCRHVHRSSQTTCSFEYKSSLDMMKRTNVNQTSSVTWATDHMACMHGDCHLFIIINQQRCKIKTLHKMFTYLTISRKYVKSCTLHIQYMYLYKY